MARTGRPPKKTVEYFSHDCNCGSKQTLYVLESRWHNDGYAFWFKLLELLGESENHFYTCETPAQWQFLAARTKVSMETAREILDCLVDLEAIDATLFRQKGIIWCQKFIDRLSDVYRRRGQQTPEKPVISANNSLSDGRKSVSTGENTQSKLKESKVNKRTPYTPLSPPAESPPLVHQTPMDVGAIEESFNQFWTAYPRKEGKAPCWKRWQKLKPPPELVGQILCAIEQQKRTENWRKQNGKYIPMPLTWLNQERWNDEIPMNNGPPAVSDITRQNIEVLSKWVNESEGDDDG